MVDFAIDHILGFVVEYMNGWPGGSLLLDWKWSYPILGRLAPPHIFFIVAGWCEDESSGFRLDLL